MENTETGSANTEDLFRFDDADDHYIYNVGVKNRDTGHLQAHHQRSQRRCHPRRVVLRQVVVKLVSFI